MRKQLHDDIIREEASSEFDPTTIANLHSMYVSLRQHFDIVIANLANNLEKAALTIQTGLDKAERTLQTSLADSKRDQQIALSEAEKRVNDKFITFKESADKTEQGMMDRINSIDSIVQRVERERTLYVTRDQLDLILKSMRGDIEPIQREQARAGGKQEGIVSTWSTVHTIITLTLVLLTILITLVVRK
jgi:hypothetical protein